MEVDTKSPLHPIVQVTNTPITKKLIKVDSMQINIFFAGYKERKAALRGQLFSPPWLHLELWGNSSGAYNRFEVLNKLRFGT